MCIVNLMILVRHRHSSVKVTHPNLLRVKVVEVYGVHVRFLSNQFWSLSSYQSAGKGNQLTLA